MSALFDYLTPDYGAKNRPDWSATPIKDDSGKVIQVRGRGRTAPFWLVTLSYARSVSNADQAVAMMAFQSALRGLKGGSVSCYFYTPSLWDWWDAVPAGTGDGSTLQFTFGGRNVQTLVPAVVYVNGVAQDASHYSISAKSGDEYGRWQITFGGAYAPDSGALVTVNFMGQRLLLGMLVSAPQDFTVPDYAQVSFQVQLQGEEV